MISRPGATALGDVRDGSAAPREAFIGAVDSRVQRILTAIERPGSTLVLIGESGSGKAYLAHSAAAAFAAEHPVPVERAVIGDSSEFASVLDGLEQRAGEGALLILALDIDRYPDAVAEALGRLARTGRARLLCTARRVAGAAERLLREPTARHLAVEPLTLEETDAFLSKMLGVERFSKDTLSRWHSATLGNEHALTTIALAAERRGVVRKTRRIAWVSEQLDEPPPDFIEQLEPLTGPERETIEMVAIASPVHEPALLRLLDSAAVASLIEREILSVSPGPEGMSALATRMPIVGEAVRTHLSPPRRAELSAVCFRALGDEAGGFAMLGAPSRLRLVRFGLEGGQSMPADWLSQAMLATRRSGDLRFALKVALAAAQHEDPSRSAEAMLRAGDLAHFLGDREAKHRVVSRLDELLRDEAKAGRLSRHRRAVLEIAAILFEPSHEGYPERGLAALDEWQRHHEASGTEAPCLAHSLRRRFLAFGGRLGAVIEVDVSHEDRQGLEDEWVSAPVGTFEALVRVQRGEFKAALAIAENSRRLVLLRELSPTLSGDLSGFLIFLAHWARGATESAKQTLESLALPARDDLSAVHSQAGLVDLAAGLFALQEARWGDAAELAGRLIKRLAAHDAFGVVPMAQAVSALALSALGEHEGAYRALQRGEQRTPGLSLALRGFVECIRLRARHWLRDPGIVSHARELIAWARTEQLALIELEAIYILAHETAEPKQELIERAALLADGIDAPIGGAILAHLRLLSRPDGETPVDARAELDGRLLSELGLWLPLPPSGQLTAREREVALFSALGYSSRQVADRLHLSSRTVETHLTHVYEKLGLSGREELRRWFSRRREAL